jgi:hypothetical protein
MKSFIYIFLFCFIAFKSNAQLQNFYSIIESENKAPFFVKYKNQILASNSNGHLIVPKLVNGNHSFKIGLPKSNQPDIEFNIIVNNNDVKYILKTEENIPSALVNVINQEITYAKSKKVITQEPPINNTAIVSSPNVNPSVAPIDTTLTNKTEIKSTITEPKKEIIITPTSPIVDTTKFVEPQQVDLPKNTNSKVQRIIDTTVQGDNLLIRYVVFYDNQPDTITVTINNNQISKTEDSEKSEVTQPTSNIDSTISNNSSKEPIDNTPHTNSPKVLYNSDCTKIATNDDVAALRKKIGGMSDAKKMNDIAIKFFKKKCFTTDQIKNLGGLYFDEMDKSKFYITAYPYTLDTVNFKSLSTTLTNEQAILFFNANVRK